MATQKAKKVAAALLAKGMLRYESHHHMFKKEIDGVTTIVTRMSQSGHEINDDLAKRMGNQCVLTLREFWNLVDCSLSADDWDSLIRQRCADGRNPFLPG